MNEAKEIRLLRNRISNLAHNPDTTSDEKMKAVKAFIKVHSIIHETSIEETEKLLQQYASKTGKHVVEVVLTCKVEFDFGDSEHEFRGLRNQFDKLLGDRKMSVCASLVDTALGSNPRIGLLHNIALERLDCARMSDVTINTSEI